MAIKAKAKGSRNERKSIDYYEAKGYRCTKSGGSLGTWDVIAIGLEDILLIQSKSNRPPKKREMEIMRNFPCHPICKKVVNIWLDRISTPLIRII